MEHPPPNPQVVELGGLAPNVDAALDRVAVDFLQVRRAVKDRLV